ncbi:sucrase/ferredoxin-like family protein [Tasmannia lanceolata]|uniref:sucrase/ferredoxin-like family protein n=1 Tax=Tasmannia lanceolata TaxID=3420 RepID=UPI00406322EA
MASNSSRDDPLSFINPSSSPILVSDNDGFLLDPNSQIGSASGSFQNDGLLAGGDSGSNSDVEFGFLRPEFRQGPLVGTVQIYDRHVFLCYKNPQVWPAHVEAAEFDRLPRLLSAALLARKGEMKKTTRLTICEGHDGTETSNGDVLIFPDMIRYRRLTHFDVDTFVEEVLVKDTEWLPGTPEILKGSYVFVCSHGSRDRKCGVCGPVLVTKFKEEIDARGLQGQVSVSPCSHIGGHKYAGNVIIFSPIIDGEVAGHWYGYVSPDDVPILLEQHVGKGEIVDRLWRGQMGLSEEAQKKTQELRLQQNGETGVEKTVKESYQPVDKIVAENGIQTDAVGCCHGSGNSYCCQNPLPEEKIEKNHILNGEGKITGKKSKDESMISSKGVTTRKSCTMPTWLESWEREDTYAALAVVAAGMSVAIAYRCYMQLR